MALAIVQHTSGINTSQVPGSITLGSTPTAGNLLLVAIHCNIPQLTATVNTSAWTDIVDAISVGFVQQVGMLLGRYVQPGDTATLPVLWTSGTTYWAYEVYEISGVTGTLTDDVPTSLIGVVANSPIGGITSISVSAAGAAASNGAIALVLAGQYDGNVTPTLSSGWTTDESGNNSSNYGSQVSGSQTGVSSGTTPTATITFTTSENPSDAFLAIIQTTLTNYSLSATTGAYTYAGVSSALNVGRKVSLSKGSYTYTGVSSTLSHGLIIHPVTGAYTYTGYAVNLPQRYAISVTAGLYTYTGIDVVLTPDLKFHATIAEFIDTTFQDWGSEDFHSFLAISQSDDMVDVKEQTPYVYTFIKETTDSNETSEGATVTGFWDWANDTSSPRVTTPQEVYKFRDGYLVSATRLKMRGRGRQLQLQFDSESGKNFNLLGWAVYYVHNAKQ